MTKGIVINAAGEPLVLGRNTPGSKVARLAAEPGNAFVPMTDDRAKGLVAALNAPPQIDDTPTLGQVVEALEAAGSAALKSRLAAARAARRAALGGGP